MVHRAKEITDDTSGSPAVAALSRAEKDLLNDFQHSFPLTSTPFATLAEQMGKSEQWVIDTLGGYRSQGLITRVGPVFAPNRVGASTLVAMAIPPESLDEIAEVVNGYPEVNHNYEREHHYNLWYVLTAPDKKHRDLVLNEICKTTGYAAISLPMVTSYHIDLGFKLKWNGQDDPLKQQKDRTDKNPSTMSDAVVSMVHDISNPVSERLVAAIQGGLPLISRPYKKIADQIGISEADCIQRLHNWLENGTVNRFGVIVRHRELGYRANAMVVWDIADRQVAQMGRCFAKFDFVNLCYQRHRHLPEWRYNLFCMIHGQDRKAVLQRVGQLVEHCVGESPVYEVLFSCRGFKQRGARYHIEPDISAEGRQTEERMNKVKALSSVND